MIALLLAACVSGPTPDARCSPGAVIPACTVSAMCHSGYSATVRHTSGKLKAQVYREYGVTTHKPGDYEIDHRVPLEVCGADVLENLWPQSYRTTPWNAHAKDKLENAVKADVCAGRLSLKAGQEIFLGDWRDAYRQRYGVAK